MTHNRGGRSTVGGDAHKPSQPFGVLKGLSVDLEGA